MSLIPAYWVRVEETPSLGVQSQSKDVHWKVNLLGRVDVVSRDGEHPKFRSRSAVGLLAFLCLKLGRDVPTHLIVQALWPDSDGDRQSQSLRRAVADLRDALEDGMRRGSVIQTKREVVVADGDHIDTDTERFMSLSEVGLRQKGEDMLSDAVALYGGPLLEAFESTWVYPFRLEYEERFVQCVEALSGLLVRSGNTREALRVSRAAVLKAPHREDIHIALISAYRHSGLEAEAIRQFEDLERMLDETWGESPSPRAKDALEGNLGLGAEPPGLTPDGDEELVGGAMPLSSKFYVRRSGDSIAEACIERGESVLLVQGQRQVGKSSLLARILAYGRDRGFDTVATDFQTIGSSQLDDEEKFYKTLAYSASIQLGQSIDIEAVWNSWLGSNMNLDSVLGSMLENTPRKVCWVIDEADRLFGRPYSNDFFGLLRSWHNRRALDPDGPWGRLTLVLSYAAEAHLFITNVDQSPFNVGILVPLSDFNKDEVAELGNRHALSDPAAVECVFQLTRGQPYLAAMAFRALKGGLACDALARTAHEPEGPFGPHLDSVLSLVSQSEERIDEVKRVLAGQSAKNPIARHRLATAGVLDATRSKMRVPFFESFLKRALG